MVKTDKDSHYVMTEWSVHQEDVTIVNIYASNIGTSKYIK